MHSQQSSVQRNWHFQLPHFQLEPRSFCCKVTFCFLARSFTGITLASCSQELAACVPPPLVRSYITRQATQVPQILATSRFVSFLPQLDFGPLNLYCPDSLLVTLQCYCTAQTPSLSPHKPAPSPLPIAAMSKDGCFLAGL